MTIDRDWKRTDRNRVIAGTMGSKTDQNKS